MGIENNLSGNTVYVLGVDYSVKDEIHWTEAVTHILQGKMTPFLVHPVKRVRSSGGTGVAIDMAHPLIVKLNYWVQTPRVREIDLNTRATRYEILRRDGHTCAYCGDKASADTVDHIKPESWCKRDGDPHNGWTWGNLVAACKECNGRKRDRTPEQAGMKLLWDPHVGGDKYARIQKEVWHILEKGEGYVPEALGYEGILTI